MAEVIISYISTNTKIRRNSLRLQLSLAQGSAKGEKTVGGQDAEENGHRFPQANRSRES